MEEAFWGKDGSKVVGGDIENWRSSTKYPFSKQAKISIPGHPLYWVCWGHWTTTVTHS